MKQKSNPDKTILTITIGFLIVYLTTSWKWAIQLSLLIGITGIISSYLSRKIEFVWMKLAWLLGQIVPNILLSVIFYFFLLPVSLLSKLFGKKDPMHLKNNGDTLFVTRNKTFDKASFENPW